MFGTTEAVRAFGPALYGCVAYFLLSVFNTVSADLTHLRHEITRLQEDRLALATAAEVDAELGTDDPREMSDPTSPPNAPASPGLTLLAVR